MAYLVIGTISAFAAAVSVYVDTGSLMLAVLTYSGTGTAVMAASLFAAWVACRLEHQGRRPVLS